MVLGIRRDESPAGIRAAFRDLARRYHPDRAGPAGTRFFQDLVEAYAVLSNHERRASYDRGLVHAGVAEPEDLLSVTPAAARPRREAEPLVPDRVSLMRDFHVTRPSYDEVFERFLRNFAGTTPPRMRQPDALRLQIVLSRELATRGGPIELGVPVFYPCTRCHGTGSVGPFSCEDCDGVGLTQEEEPIRVRIPAGVPDGTVIELPLRGLGIHNIYLRLMVRVAD
jgi:DnaJ-class molecular chaperone